MKWRTDLLPTRLDIPALIRAAQYQPHAALPGRLVMTGFRNLTLWPDWLSSFPDLFCFGPLDLMELFWDLHQFDTSLPINVPAAMLSEDDFEMPEPDRLYYQGVDITDDYDPHVEFYAIFKDRLQHRLNCTLSHDQIVREVLYLIDCELLQICWFRAGNKLAFRICSPPHALVDRSTMADRCPGRSARFLDPPSAQSHWYSPSYRLHPLLARHESTTPPVSPL